MTHKRNPKDEICATSIAHREGVPATPRVYIILTFLLPCRLYGSLRHIQTTKARRHPDLGCCRAVVNNDAGAGLPTQRLGQLAESLLDVGTRRTDVHAHIAFAAGPEHLAVVERQMGLVDEEVEQLGMVEP